VGQPTAAEIKVAIALVEKLPDAGDHGHVQQMFPIENKLLPAVPSGSWTNAKQKTVKLRKLYATNQQLDRDNLIWHLKHPGMSKFTGPRNTHIQVLKLNSGHLAIVDGHHRAAALKLLGVKKDMVWLLKESDLPTP
jgi:hypothetical protein